MKYKNLIEVIQARSNSTDRGITFITRKNKEKFISYKELYHKSLLVLGYLQSQRIEAGEELLFQVDNNEDFIYLYWACILGGIIPVPVTVGKNEEHKLKVFNIWTNLNNPYLISGGKRINSLQKYAANNDLKQQMKTIENNFLLLDDIKGKREEGRVHKAKADDIAYIQFSSGSTGTPKGVVLTHKNLLTNIRQIINGANFSSKDSFLSWMPLTHDMGLIGYHLVPLILNVNQCLMPTRLFIRRPYLWLKKASKHRVSILSSPNFGYKHFLKFYKPEQLEDVDLSCVKLIFNGAEPISKKLCDEFLTKLKKFGLKRKTMFPVYGLAEASLAVSFPPVQEEFSAVKVERDSIAVGEKIKEIKGKDDYNQDKIVTFIDVGYPLEGCKIRICDKNSKELGDKAVGHIQIKGNNVTNGYYNDLATTEGVMTDDGWLDTGDLGFIRDNRLVITGRAEDVILVNGQNYYAHDMERIIQELNEIDLKEVAVGSVFNESQRQEDIIVFIRYKKELEEFIPLLIKIKQHINKKLGLQIKHIIPLRSLPKTTSGKLQRYKLIARYQKGEFDSKLEKIKKLLAVQAKEKQLESNSVMNRIKKILIRNIDQEIGTEDLDEEEDLTTFGINSVNFVELVVAIEAEFGIEFEEENLDFNEFQTLNDIIAYVQERRKS